VGVVGVEIVAEDGTVLSRLDCRAAVDVFVIVAGEGEVIGGVDVGEKDLGDLTLVIPLAEAKAWVSREGPVCLGRGPGPRAFLLLEVEAETGPRAAPMGRVSAWSGVSLALASPRGK
jgi:hypothetical protein